MVIELSTRARTIGAELDSYNHACIALYETLLLGYLGS